MSRRSKSILPEEDRRQVKPGRRVVDDRRQSEEDEAYDTDRRVKTLKGDPNRVLEEELGEEESKSVPRTTGKTAKNKAALPAKMAAKLAAQAAEEAEKKAVAETRAKAESDRKARIEELRKRIKGQDAK